MVRSPVQCQFSLQTCSLHLSVAPVVLLLDDVKDLIERHQIELAERVNRALVHRLLADAQGVGLVKEHLEAFQLL